MRARARDTQIRVPFRRRNHVPSLRRSKGDADGRRMCTMGEPGGRLVLPAQQLQERMGWMGFAVWNAQAEDMDLATSEDEDGTLPVRCGAPLASRGGRSVHTNNILAHRSQGRFISPRIVAFTWYAGSVLALFHIPDISSCRRDPIRVHPAMAFSQL